MILLTSLVKTSTMISLNAQSSEKLMQHTIYFVSKDITMKRLYLLMTVTFWHLYISVLDICGQGDLIIIFVPAAYHDYARVRQGSKS